MRQTDDILPFRTSLIGEYALLIAPPPFGLGLSEDEVRAIAKMSMDARFDTTTSRNLKGPEFGTPYSLTFVPIVLGVLFFYFSK